MAALERVSLDVPFGEPRKEIYTNGDMAQFQESIAYQRLVTFLSEVSQAVMGRDTVAVDKIQIVRANDFNCKY